MPLEAIGLVELSSIAIGHVVQDAMLKAANVDLLMARTICSGKYIVVVGGDVAACTSAVEAGVDVSGDALIEDRLIPRLHPSVFPALSQSVELKPEQARAMGIVETFSASSIIDCADAAAKAADVILYRIHIAMAIGGKGFFLLTGDVAACKAAVEAGAAMASKLGMLVSKVVIPGPRIELFEEYI
ncbi:MAG: BMC domain-containing protein [bacterium]